MSKTLYDPVTGYPCGTVPNGDVADEDQFLSNLARKRALAASFVEAVNMERKHVSGGYRGSKYASKNVRYGRTVHAL